MPDAALTTAGVEVVNASSASMKWHECITLDYGVVNSLLLCGLSLASQSQML